MEEVKAKPKRVLSPEALAKLQTARKAALEAKRKNKTITDFKKEEKKTTREEEYQKVIEARKAKEAVAPPEELPEKPKRSHHKKPAPPPESEEVQRKKRKYQSLFQERLKKRSQVSQQNSKCIQKQISINYTNRPANGSKMICLVIREDT